MRAEKTVVAVVAFLVVVGAAFVVVSTHAQASPVDAGNQVEGPGEEVTTDAPPAASGTPEFEAANTSAQAATGDASVPTPAAVYHLGAPGHTPSYSSRYRGAIPVALVAGYSDAVVREAAMAHSPGENEHPTASASASPSRPAPGETVTFDASDSSDPDGEIVEYRWDFDADRDVDRVTDEPTTTWIYDLEQFHTAVLTVVDDDGAMANATGSVSVGMTEEPGSERTFVESVETTEEFTESVERNYSYEIPFRSGSYTPEPGLDENVSTDDPPYVLVQFSRQITDDEWRTLRDLGYRREAWLTRTDRYAAIPADRHEEIIDLPFVRAIEPIRSEWKLDPVLVERLEEAESDEYVSVTVDTFEPISDSQLDRTDDSTSYRGRVRLSRLLELDDDPRVKWIELWVPSEPSVTEGRELVNVPAAAQRSSAIDVGGAGVRVGVIDTGIDHGHPHFDPSQIVDSWDWADGDSYPEAHPTCDHGTHVAGTIAGSGTNTSQNDRIFRGVAPASTVVISKIFTEDDAGFNDDNGKCDRVEKPFGPKNMFKQVHGDGAVIISNSWGGDNDGKYKSQAHKVDTWIRNHPNEVVVFSNGNSGDSTHVSSPGLAKNVIAVGAVRDGSNAGGISRSTLNWTNVESGLNDLEPTEDRQAGSIRRKPDVSAPGHVTTAPTIGGNYSVGGAYTTKGGTSMAAPHVSGVAALYKQVHPGASAGEVKASLVATTNPVFDSPRDQLGDSFVVGYGMIDANNAIYENRYESAQKHWEDTVYNAGPSEVDTDTRTFQVPEGAEQVVVVLTWLDPGHDPATLPVNQEKKKGKNVLVNDLTLHVGPTHDPERHESTGVTNVRKIVVDDPEGGTNWRIAVKGNRVTPGPGGQPFDVVYRVIEDEPGLHVDPVKRVDVDVGNTTTANSTILGTGAPVAGINTNTTTEANLFRCNSGVSVVGVLSDGYEANVTNCFGGNTYGDYNATMVVNATPPGAMGYARTDTRLRIEQDIEVHVAETRPPNAVTNVYSPSHNSYRNNDRWSSDREVTWEWDTTTDNGPSGLSHYLVEVTRSNETEPDESSFLVGGNLTSIDRLFDTGNFAGEFWFHIRAVDEDGNMGPVTHRGPYTIDTIEPTEVRRLRAKHFEYSTDPSGYRGQPVGYTSTDTAEFSWFSASDQHSGILGYNVSWYVIDPANCPSNGCLLERESNFLTERPRSVTLGSDRFPVDEGLYRLEVGAVDRARNENATNYYFHVDRTDPSADLDVDTENVSLSDPVQFDASDSFDDVGIYEYEWNFDDGTTQTTTDPVVNHTYTAAGTYIVEVEVVDRAGNAVTDSVALEIEADGNGTVFDVGQFDRVEFEFDGSRDWYTHRLASLERFERLIAVSQIGLNPEEPPEPPSRFEVDVATVDGPVGAEPYERVLGEEDGHPYVLARHSDPFDGSSRLSFAVSEGVLEDAGVGPDEAALYRYSGEAGWRRLDTRTLGTVDGSFHYRSEFDGLSLFVVADGLVEVEMDVKPNGDESDPINVDSQGRLPVAVLNTSSFDPRDVNVSTLELGPDNASAVRHGFEDVDDDGDLDLVVHFETQEVGLTTDDEEVVLTGELTDRTRLVGEDDVTVRSRKGG